MSDVLTHGCFHQQMRKDEEADKELKLHGDLSTTVMDSEEETLTTHSYVDED